MISDDNTYEFIALEELSPHNDDSYVNLSDSKQSPSPSPAPYDTDSRISFLENLLMSKAKTICKNKYNA